MKSKLPRIIRPLIPENGFGDKLYSTITFLVDFNRWPNYHSPKTFNEHLLRLKLSSKPFDPLWGFITDKEYFKMYVKNQVGSEFVVNTYLSLIHI